MERLILDAVGRPLTPPDDPEPAETAVAVEHDDWSFHVAMRDERLIPVDHLRSDLRDLSENDDVLLLFRTALCDEDDAVTDGNVASHSVGLEARDNARRRGESRLHVKSGDPVIITPEGP